MAAAAWIVDSVTKRIMWGVAIQVFQEARVSSAALHRELAKDVYFAMQNVMMQLQHEPCLLFLVPNADRTISMNRCWYKLSPYHLQCCCLEGSTLAAIPHELIQALLGLHCQPWPIHLAEICICGSADTRKSGQLS